MASLFPRMSWCSVSGGIRPEIVSDPQRDTVISITRHGKAFLSDIGSPRGPEERISFQGSDTNAHGSGPAVYLFSTNDLPNIRNTGAPELTTKFRSSFDPEPQWLDDPTWYDDDGRSRVLETSEVKDGLRFDSIQL